MIFTPTLVLWHVILTLCLLPDWWLSRRTPLFTLIDKQFDYICCLLSFNQNCYTTRLSFQYHIYTWRMSVFSSYSFLWRPVEVASFVWRVNSRIHDCWHAKQSHCHRGCRIAWHPWAHALRDLEEWVKNYLDIQTLHVQFQKSTFRVLKSFGPNTLAYF